LQNEAKNIRSLKSDLGEQAHLRRATGGFARECKKAVTDGSLCPYETPGQNAVRPDPKSSNLH